MKIDYGSRVLNPMGPSNGSIIMLLHIALELET